MGCDELGAAQKRQYPRPSRAEVAGEACCGSSSCVTFRRLRPLDRATGPRHPLLMLIKICGITRPEDAEATVAAGADLVGFVFVPGTPRAVDAEEAGWIRDLAGVETVGVFRDAPLESMQQVRRLLDLDRVQLHGNEPDEWIEPLGSGVIRRVPSPIREGERARVELLTAIGALALVDPGAGDGVACDWGDLGRRLCGLSIGLAGGLRPENVRTAIQAAKPCLVDVSSGVESAPGVKDITRIEAFIAEVRRVAGDGFEQQ